MTVTDDYIIVNHSGVVIYYYGGDASKLMVVRNFQEWLGAQWGPGKKYPTPRQLSFAISNGKNPGAVGDLEKRGISRLDTAEKVAIATGSSLIEVLVAAGWIKEEDLQQPRLSQVEWRLVEAYRETRDDLKPFIEGLTESLRGSSSALKDAL